MVLSVIYRIRLDPRLLGHVASHLSDVGLILILVKDLVFDYQQEFVNLLVEGLSNLLSQVPKSLEEADRNGFRSVFSLNLIVNFNLERFDIREVNCPWILWL
jgi:hypothetical protein